MSRPVLSIGLLAHTPLQHRTLRILVEQCGHSVSRCLLLAELVGEELKPDGPSFSADAWIVAIDLETGQGECEAQDIPWLDRGDWLGHLAGPVIFCDGAVPGLHELQYPAWARRLTGKLNQLSGAINLAQSGYGSAKQVWVLAASTGGPAAVKEFMGALPPGLGIGFIYVQHIDVGFKDMLTQALNSGSHYPAYLAEHGSVAQPNAVAVVSPDHATELLPNGTFIVNPQPWAAPYSPSVDFVVANVAHSFGARSGLIVFSGMGDDGAMSSRLMRQKGGKVWVQTPSTCTSDSMPQATLAAGCVDFAGSPASLAQELARTLATAAKPEVVESGAS